MDNKKEKIQELITKIANKTIGITEEQISRARKLYENDSRSIEEIEAELERLSSEITKATLRKKEMKAKESIDVTKNTDYQTSKVSTQEDDDYYKTEILDFDFGEVDIEKSVNDIPTLIPQTESLQEPLQQENPELSSMFEEQQSEQMTIGEEKTTEKGKVMVKSNNPVNNNAGYATTLNLAFMMSTISIAGLFIASIIIGLSRLIG